MNLRRQPPQDSLDLLLDTMCNAFGGIILLAVMIALLARDVPRPSRGQDDKEMTQRRIMRAAADVERLRAELASLNARVASPVLSQRMELATEQARLQAQLSELQSAAQAFSSNAPSAAADPAARLAQLRTQMAEVLLQSTAASNAITAAIEDAERLRRRATALTGEVSQASEVSEQRLRLPREHRSERDSFAVILRHGRFYPLYRYSGSGLDRNTDTVVWREASNDTLIVTPKPGTGPDFAAGAGTISQLLAGLPKDRIYIAFYVYDDSFPAFAAAKRMVLGQGLQYGWRPYKSDENLILSSRGTKVPLQ